MTSLLHEISRKYSLDIEKLHIVDKYLDLLIKVNRKINLTSSGDIDRSRVIHIEDSLSGFVSELFVNEIKYADIGSGCGFPGVANGILGSCKTLLIDSSTKKMKAVQGILDELGLDYIQTISSRIEELPKHYLSYFDVVSARALSSLPSILELSSPLLKPKGIFIAYKGQIEEDELSSGFKTAELVGFTLHSQTNVRLLDGSSRIILYFQKTGEPQLVLPRRNGLAQRKPLGKR